jgi:deoxyribodipyrimidine photo-lyase
METAIVLFSRDLRVRDNPALALACARARQVVPLFVMDTGLTVPPNRARFLAEPVAELIRLAERTAGQAVFVAGDVSRYVTLRQQRLARECARHRLALEITPGHAVVPAAW